MHAFSHNSKLYICTNYLITGKYNNKKQKFVLLIIRRSISRQGMNMKMKTCISFFLILFFAVVSAKEYDEVDDGEQGFPGNSIATFKDMPNYSDFEDDLTFSYYHRSCPDAEAIIQRKVDEWVKKDDTLAPSLIRLQYHDCVVRVRN